MAFRAVGTIPPGGKRTRQFLRAAMDADTDECIIWPYSKTQDGYGTLDIHHVRWRAHRYICFIAHGAPPKAKQLACHSCGQQLCVNPRHLRWGSAADNGSDARGHGTTPKGRKNANAKLTDAQAREIFLSIEPHEMLAKHHGVTRTAVQQIQAGGTWKHATRGLVAPEGRLIPGQRWSYTSQ